jgi:hypothetical protein
MINMGGKNRIDITGQRFDRILVLSYNSTKNKITYWNCICDCGKEKLISGSSLRNKCTRSCGCLAHEIRITKGRKTKKKWVDITGQRFGKLVVLGYTDDRKRGYAIWRVQCDCGSPEKTYCTASLTSRKKPTRSCGCLWRKPLGEACRLRVLRGYKRNAKTRSHVWGLTDNQFFSLIQQVCHYCGRNPSNTSYEKESNGSYIYNGIDRKNGTLGYFLENCVPCCRPCNWAKRHMSYDEFMAYLQQLVQYHNEKQTFTTLNRMAAISY